MLQWIIRLNLIFLLAAAILSVGVLRGWVDMNTLLGIRKEVVVFQGRDRSQTRVIIGTDAPIQSWVPIPAHAKVSGQGVVESATEVPRSGSFEILVDSSPAELHRYYGELLRTQGYTIRELHMPRVGAEDLLYWMDAQHVEQKRTLSVRIYKENPRISAEILYWELLWPAPFPESVQLPTALPSAVPSAKP